MTGNGTGDPLENAPIITARELENNIRYYVLPKLLFENEAYAEMKLESKMLYAILRDRTMLSLKNNWVDDKGRVYIKYKNADLCDVLSVGEKKLIQLKKQLREYDLVFEIRKGDKQANWIYISDLQPDYGVVNKPESRSNNELSNGKYVNLPNDSSRTGENTVRELSKLQSSDTDSSDTNSSDTNSFKREEDDDTSHKSSANFSMSQQSQTDEIAKIIISEIGFSNINATQKREITRWLKTYDVRDIMSGINRAALHGAKTLKYIEQSIISTKEETDQLIKSYQNEVSL